MIGSMTDERNTHAVSPTRTYVAVCNVRRNGKEYTGYQFRKFTIPEHVCDEVERNDAGLAAWYYLNRLNAVAYIDGCIPFEDYSDLITVTQ